MNYFQSDTENNELDNTYMDIQQAMYAAQDFSDWDDEHYYQPDELDLQVV